MARTRLLHIVPLAVLSTLAAASSAGAQDLAAIPNLVDEHRDSFRSRITGSKKPIQHDVAAHSRGFGMEQSTTAPRFRITDIGSLDPGQNGYTTAYAINAFAQVTGSGATPEIPCGPYLCSFSQAFLADETGINGIGALSLLAGSSGNDIDSIGRIVGSSVAFDGINFGPATAFLWEQGVMHALDTPLQSSGAFGLNDQGWIVGYTQESSEVGQPIVWRGGSYRLLDMLPGSNFGYASDVNESGLIVGGSQDALEVNQPVAWNRGTLIPLPVLDQSAVWGEALAVNDNSQIVGSTAVRNDQGIVHQRATLWLHGVPQELGVLNGPQSRAYDINNDGWIVGQSDTIGGGGRAFLWIDGVMHDLQDLISPLSGWTVTHARGINNAGQIVGEGMCPCGGRRGFVMTPVQ